MLPFAFLHIQVLMLPMEVYFVHGPARTPLRAGEYQGWLSISGFKLVLWLPVCSHPRSPDSGSTLYYFSVKHVSKFSEPSRAPLWKGWKNTAETVKGIACFQLLRTSRGLTTHPFLPFWLLYLGFAWCPSIAPYANFLVSFSMGIAVDQTKHFLSISWKEGTSQYTVNGYYLLDLLTVKIPFDCPPLSLNCAVGKIKPSFSRENRGSHFLVSFQGALSLVLKCSAQCSWIHLLYCFIFFLIQFY